MAGLIISFIFYNFIVMLIYGHFKRGEYNISNNQLIFFTLLFIAFGTYGNHLGDYWRINEVIETYGVLSSDVIGVSMEKHYYLLAKLVNGNYVLWRLVINCVAFIGFAFFLRKSKMANYPTLLLFATMCLFWVAGHRGWWGYIYYYFGVYLFFRDKKYIYLILAAVSYFSHSSNILLIALLPIAFFKFNRFYTIVIIVVLILGLDKLQEYFDFMVGGGVENEYYSHKLNTYSSQTANNYFGSSIGEYLQNFFTLVPKYLFMFYMLKSLLFNKKYMKCIRAEHNAIINISINLFLVSIAAFFMNLGSGTIAYRLFTMSTFPIFILSDFILNGRYQKYKLKMTYWFLISIELVYIFSIYYASIHGVNPTK